MAEKKIEKNLNENQVKPASKIGSLRVYQKQTWKNTYV